MKSYILFYNNAIYFTREDTYREIVNSRGIHIVTVDVPDDYWDTVSESNWGNANVDRTYRDIIIIRDFDGRVLPHETVTFDDLPDTVRSEIMFHDL